MGTSQTQTERFPHDKEVPVKRLARLTMVVLGLSVLAPVFPQAAEAQGPPKVTIIHKGRTITVGPIAAAMHVLLHGDTFVNTDACPPNCGL